MWKSTLRRTLTHLPICIFIMAGICAPDTDTRRTVLPPPYIHTLNLALTLLFTTFLIHIHSIFPKNKKHTHLPFSKQLIPSNMCLRCVAPPLSKGCKVMQTRTYMQTCITMPSINPLRRIYVLGTKHKKKRVECRIISVLFSVVWTQSRGTNLETLQQLPPLVFLYFIFFSSAFFLFSFSHDVCSSKGLLFIFSFFVNLWSALKWKKKTFLFPSNSPSSNLTALLCLYKAVTISSRLVWLYIFIATQPDLFLNCHT